MRQFIAYAVIVAMAGVTSFVAAPYDGVDHWAVYAGGCAIAVMLAAIISPPGRTEVAGRRPR